MKAWFAELGITEVDELDWWESRKHKGLEIHFVPVQHWSKRTPSDENQTLWGGWVLRHPELSFFFAPTINAYKRYQKGSWAPTASSPQRSASSTIASVRGSCTL